MTDQFDEKARELAWVMAGADRQQEIATALREAVKSEREAIASQLEQDARDIEAVADTWRASDDEYVKSQAPVATSHARARREVADEIRSRGGEGAGK